MGLFDKAKRALGYPDESLRERGIAATAKVVSAKKGLMSDEDSGEHVYKLELLVTVPGAEPYPVKYKMEGGLPVGGEYSAFVDPKDPTKVFVDGAGDARRRVADKLGQATGKSVTPDMGSIQQAVAGVQSGGTLPGLSPEYQQMMGENAKRALALVTDPTQRKMLIENYRAAGIVVDE